MKKIISILLSLALLLSCAAALAETAETTETAETPATAETLATAEKTDLGSVYVNGEFALKAAIPEGYDMEIIDNDFNGIMAVFTNEDKNKPLLVLTVGLEDAWEPGSLLNNVSAEDLAEIEASFYEEDNPVEIYYTETEHGTKLLVAKYTESNMVIIYTLYEGYEIEFMLSNADGTELTSEQIDTCIKFLSDLDFVKIEK
jgi:hypothetical protein